jgi:hypothetical protein
MNADREMARTLSVLDIAASSVVDGSAGDHLTAWDRASRGSAFAFLAPAVAG